MSTDYTLPSDPQPESQPTPGGAPGPQGGGAPKGAGIAPILLILGAVVVGGIFVVVILAAIAIPNFVNMQYRAKRAEIPVNVQGIKTAEMAYELAFDEYVQVSSYNPSSIVGKAQQNWRSGTRFDTLGWAPDGKVRGAYKVVSTSSTDFRITGISDVDGDGSQARYTATKSINATMVTSNSTF